MRKIVVMIGILACAGFGFGGWRWLETPATAQARPPAPPAIPVDVAAATRGDAPLYQSGLGTVQAFNTVTVKVRVDGQLDKVSFVEGQMVARGDLLAQIDPRPYQAALDQAIAKQAQDESLLGNARLDLDRYAQLATREFATRQSLDTQKALVAQLEAAVKGDQAVIENARVQLGYTTITAPLAGRTGIRLVDQGNIVHATDTTGLVVITQVQPITVLFTLPEEALGSISDAMAKGPVQVAALSRDQKSQLDQGTIALVDNEIDQATGTIRLKATFPNPANKLWPGQFVNTRVLVGTQQNVVIVPADAVERGPNGLYTYVVKPDRSVELRPLKVGQLNNDIAVIDDGLEPGEQVVTAGQYRLQPGVVVTPRSPGAQETAGSEPVKSPS